MKWGEFLERRRVTVSYVFGLAYLVFACPVPASIAAGSVLMLAGAALRTWASGHIRKQAILATDGPYAHTRNPLYLGTFLIALGALGMGRNWWLAVLFLVFAVPVYLTVMRREEEILEKKFGDAFRDFRAAVPFFFPRFSPYRGRYGNFEWALVQKHREWQVWLGIAAVILFLLGRYYLWGHTR